MKNITRADIEKRMTTPSAILRREENMDAFIDSLHRAKPKVEGVNFDRIPIGATEWGEGSFTNCSFDAADLAGVSLFCTVVDKCSLESVTASRLGASRAQFDFCIFEEADFKNSDFTAACLKNVYAHAIEATQALFRYAVFIDINFRCSNFEKASFYGALFRNVSFEDCNLSYVDFRYARFRDCKFSKAILFNTNFTDAKFEGGEPEGIKTTTYHSERNPACTNRAAHA